jgi:hypothetical protein
VLLQGIRYSWQEGSFDFWNPLACNLTLRWVPDTRGEDFREEHFRDFDDEILFLPLPELMDVSETGFLLRAIVLDTSRL